MQFGISSNTNQASLPHPPLQMDRFASNGLVSEHRLDMPLSAWFQIDFFRLSKKEWRAKLHSLPFKLIYFLLLLVWQVASFHRDFTRCLCLTFEGENCGLICILCYLAHWGCSINIKQEGFIESLCTIHFLVHPLCQLPVQKHYKKMAGWID